MSETAYDEHFVSWFRAVTPYINAFRGRTFVVAFGGKAVASESAKTLAYDVNLLVSLGIRLVLVHGARPQIEAALSLCPGARFWIGFGAGQVLVDHLKKACSIDPDNPAFADCIRLVTAALTAPRVGFTLSFGLSDNAVNPVDNRLAGHLGYFAQDNTEAFRAGVEAKFPPPDPKAPAVQRLGGWFVDLGHPDDETAP